MVRRFFFYLTWPDDTEDRNLGTNIFADACAIMFPLEEMKSYSIIMGFMGKANIWQWKAGQDSEYWRKQMPGKEAYTDFYYPFEEKEIFPVSKKKISSSVNDLLVKGPGTITANETNSVAGRGLWREGFWHVVMKRSFKGPYLEREVIFSSGGKMICAFAIWNGSTGDRGGRKSISEWVKLEIQ